MARLGNIFNIQRFCTHDGPGIRTTVFLKGCPLSCQWCANPESISPAPQLMTRDIKCTGCRACVEVCPEKVIVFDEKGKRLIDRQRCKECFKCANACLYGALSVIGEERIPENIIEIIEKDRIFYENSGGGVTVSGGEPLMQPGFLVELLGLLRSKKLHVTLDTTGFASRVVVEKIIPLVDLVLFDIKHLDPESHNKYTKVDNRVILENAAFISREVKTWFRIPLIKGVNDDKDHISRVADLAVSFGVEKISLLPFHEGGMSKWRQVGEVVPDFKGEAPDEEHIQFIARVIKEKGVQVRVGS